MIWRRVKLTERQWRLAKLWSPICAALAFLLVAAVFWLPALAERRIRQRLKGHGLDFRAEIGLSLSGARLRNVEVSTLGGGRVLFARNLDAAVSYWSGELKSLSIADAELRLDLAWLAEWRRRRAGATPGAAVSKPSEQHLPPVTLVRTNIYLRDKQGVFAGAEQVSGQLAGDAFRLAAARAFMGAAPGEVVEAKALAASGGLGGRGLKIQRVEAKDATLRWNSEGGLDRGASLTRLALWRSELKPTSAAKVSGGTTGSRFADDAKIELGRVQILDVSPTGQVTTLLDDLRVSAHAQGQKRWRLLGKGAVRSEPSGTGSIEWDLQLAPQELKVEGRLRLDEVALSLLAPVLPPLPFFELDRTRVRADLQISGTGLSAAAVKGELSIRDLVFASAGLAETAVGPISFDAKGEALWTPAKRELSALHAEVRTGKTKTLVSGNLAWPTGSYRVDLVADMQRAQCRDVLFAVPAALLGELASVELSGDLAAKLTVHVDAEALDATVVDFDIADKCRFGHVPELLDLRRFDRPFLHTVFEPDGTVFEMETGPGSAAWTPIELMSPFMTQAAIAHEDGRFLSHRGFAEPEIARALARNLKAKAFRFGASTITMQLVKNLFLHRDKLLSRKVQEAFIVWWLEQHWDKRRILETYLNVIEYGPAIYGIRNAALHYFGEIPLDLTPAQAAFFASILPSPKTFHEQYEKRALSVSMKSRIGSFLQHMASRQRIDEEALKFGLEELNTFKFYDPNQPPPAPLSVRGTAQPLPFVRPGLGFDAWGAGTSLEEDGSFGL